MTATLGEPRSLHRYLLRGERAVVAVRRHWVKILEPWATTAATFVLAAALSFDFANPSQGRIFDLFWWVFFAATARAVFCTYDWRHTWFIATDRRLLLIHGFITRKVAMMPLAKVTDMTYHRSIPGRLLGYGTFVMESAGQEQALHEIDRVPHPDATYRAIITEIFQRDSDVADLADLTDSDLDLFGEAPDGEGAPHLLHSRYDDVPVDPPFDDPTSRYAMPPHTSRVQGLAGLDGPRPPLRTRLAIFFGFADPPYLGGDAATRPAHPRPDPSVGARHEPRRTQGIFGDRDGEPLYSSEDVRRDASPTRPQDPPRDATGYWDR